MAQYKIKGLANTPSYRIKGLANQEENNNQEEQSQEETGLSSIPNDLKDLVINFGLGAGNKAMQLPGEISEAGNQLYDKPLTTPPRIARNVLSGILEGAKGAYNLPLELTGYLAKKTKDIPYAGAYFNKFAAPLAEKLKIGDTGLKEKALGEEQAGDQLWQDLGMIAPIAGAPKALGKNAPALTAKQITQQMSKHKSAALEKAKIDYGKLFEDAKKIGLKNAEPSDLVYNQRKIITQNSTPKHHRAYNEYLQNPTLENAHWAQSELGALERHLNKISDKNGLTPIQHKTLKAANKAREDIKKSMFSENGLGKSPALGERYNQLSEEYRKKVIPYTRLEELSDVEKGRMRPKSAIKSLRNDEQFMIDLAKKYPGLALHSALAKKIGIGGIGLLGYDEIKKIIALN